MSGPSFRLNSSGSWGVGQYLGICDVDGTSSLVPNIVPWVAPAAGTIKFLYVQGMDPPNSTIYLTLYKSSGSTAGQSGFSYAATALTITLTSGVASGNDTTHTVTVAAGDLLVMYCDNFWSANGVHCNCEFIPS